MSHKRIQPVSLFLVRAKQPFTSWTVEQYEGLNRRILSANDVLSLWIIYLRLYSNQPEDSSEKKTAPHFSPR